MTIELKKMNNGKPVLLALLYDALVETVDDAVCINGHDEEGSPYEYSFYNQELKDMISKNNEDTYKFIDGSAITITYI